MALKSQKSNKAYKDENFRDQNFRDQNLIIKLTLKHTRQNKKVMKISDTKNNSECKC